MITRVARSCLKAGFHLGNFTTKLVRRRGGAHVILIHGVGGEDLPADEFKDILTWLKDEIRGSAERLVSELDRAIDFFCFPNGAYGPLHLEIVRQHYRAAVATRPGINEPGIDVVALSRVSINPIRSEMAWKLYRARG